MNKKRSNNFSEPEKKDFKAFRNKNYDSSSANNNGLVSSLPMLNAPTSEKPSNLHICLEKWKQYSLLNYGEIGSIFTDLEYPEPDVPEQPLQEDLDNDGTGFVRSSYLEKAKLYEKRCEDIRNKRVQVFALIFGQLSEESKQVASMSSKYSSVVEKSNHPVKLLKILIKTHSTNLTGINALDRKTSRDYYNSMTQSKEETLLNFKRRYEEALKALLATGEPLPSEASQAVDFLSKLDRGRYSEFDTDLSNNAARLGQLGFKGDSFPNTLMKVYELASRWKIVGKPHGAGSTHSSSGVAFVASGGVNDLEKQRREEQSKRDKTAFVQLGGKGAKGGNKRDRKKGHAGKGNKGREVTTSSGDKESAAGIKCYLCGEPGHKSSDCGHRNAFKEYLETKKLRSRTLLVAEAEQTIFMLRSVETALVSELGEGVIVLDNGATHHLFRDKNLLQNLRDLDNPVSYNGVGGRINVTKGGDLPNIGLVHYSPEAPVNILSFSTLRRACIRLEYDYDNDTWLVQATVGKPVRFVRNDSGLYVYHLRFKSIHMATVTDNEARYTKREVEGAKRARLLKESAGYPSNADLAWALARGDIINTDVTAKDLKRMVDIYGPSLGDLKGKTKRGRPSITDIEPVESFMREAQTLEEDIMFVDQIPFLVSLSTPLDLIIISELKARTATELWSVQFRHLGIYKAEGFAVHKVFFDREGGIGKIEAKLLDSGYRLQQVGAGSHVPRLEVKLRVIKERLRGIINTLAYTLPKSLLPWAAYYVVIRLNCMPVHTRMDPTPARQILLGRKVDAGLDYALSFGQYVQVHEEDVVTNTMKSRTEGALALKPDDNAVGSWSFWKLKTWKLVHRAHWTVIPIPEEVIEFINAKAAAEKEQVDKMVPMRMGRKVVEDRDRVEDDTIPGVPMPARVVPEDHVQPELEVETANDNTNQTDPGSEGLVQDTDDNASVDQSVGGVEEVIVVDSESDRESDEVVRMESDEESDVSVGPFAGLKPHVDWRQTKARHIRREEALALLAGRRTQSIFNMTVHDALTRYGTRAEEAIEKELKQLMDKEVFEPVQRNSLTAEEQRAIIPSKMFLKDKYKPDGSFDKIKARLVAGGHRQDRDLYEDVQISSPTVSTGNLFIVAVIAAEEGREVATADIGTAYPNAFMKMVVHMRINAEVSRLLVKLNAAYGAYLTEKGEIIVKLIRALYGCIESGKLWNELLTAELQGLGYTQNKCDDCVFNRSGGTHQSTIVVYVDDLLITCVERPEIDRVLQHLRARFSSISEHHGRVHSYLGMTLDFTTPSAVNITMNGYVHDMLGRYKIFNEKGHKVTTPGTEDLFTVTEDSEALKGDKAERFHSIVATLLYLAKRARPDVLCAVCFLATRVQCATEEDFEKVIRVLKYINGTKDLGITLRCDKTMQVRTYIDASYGVHADGKGHSGIFSTLGSGPIYVKSTKQKLNTRSSTEAELVAISDGLSPAIGHANFLEQQGYKRQPVILYQDNQSTMKLVLKGKSTSDSTRHIGLRFFFVHDKVTNGEVKMEYMPTKSMIADIFTKSILGALFVWLRELLMGER